MEINCKAWNPSMHETMCQVRQLAPDVYNEPLKAIDNAIDMAITALRVSNCNPYVATTITLPLDEYRLLISDAQIKAREEGCKEGREEAWDLARRIAITGDGCYAIDEVNKVFGDLNILRTPVEEVLARDKKYQEEKKKLHIGDEVEFGFEAISNKKYRGYIINFVLPNTVRVLTKEVGTVRIESEDCEKTGKHSDEIEKVMASFEEEEDK